MAARDSRPRTIFWQGIEPVDPNFYFRYENFNFTGDGMMEVRQRPKAASGAIWSEGSGARDDLLPLADIRQDGSPSSIHTTFSVAGHLIAKTLTGLDKPENLVNITKATNDKMSRVERELQKLASPHWLVVDVNSYFDAEGDDHRVPRTFRYSLYAGGTKPGFGVGPLRTWDVVQDWSSVGPYSYSTEFINIVEKAKSALAFGWKIETCTSAGPDSLNMTFLAGKLPPPENRPLAFLDFILIRSPGQAAKLGVSEQQIKQYLRNIGPKKKFKPKWVRQLAIMGNVLAHNNWLMSDVYDRRDAVIQLKEGIVVEPHSSLLVGSGANAPQVDHIFPESLGGPNCFSNAQITSQQYNSQKGKAVEILQFRDEAWKSEMGEKMKTDKGIQYLPGGTSSFFGT